MTALMTKEEYKHYSQTAVPKEGAKREALQEYILLQFHRLDELTAMISHETFWAVFPKILGVDAKLALITELISFEDFSNEAIIDIVETDYRTYFKELCGYDLKTQPNPSMIFTIQ